MARSTVINTLKSNGFDPGPQRGKGSWNEFLRMHAETLWQCDFFSKQIWTATGLRQFFVLAFLHVGSRRVFVSEACCKPDAVWMRAQVEQFVEHVKQNKDVAASHLIHDLDGKFGKGFDELLESHEIKVTKVGPRAPNLNAFIERWIQSIKHECLDQFIICGHHHFNYLISQFVEHYLGERPHQALGNVPLSRERTKGRDEPPETGEVQCRSRLGFLLHHNL